ncbi:MAG TPA: hypothetical protein VD741_06700, partial [Solirubrobacterales bacterium]|nr:hypothetical protein [Solirubrobacterales bacterium]
RLPSFAGQGLPERLRSTAFAFLGLTAAAGLALVATFAQLGFPVLSPEPMPSGPAKPSAVAGAVAIEPAPRAAPVRRQRGSALQPRPRSEASRGGSAQPVSRPAAPAAVETPATTPSPDPAPAAGGVNAGRTEAPVPQPTQTPSSAPDPSPPAPVPLPEPAAEPVPAPVVSPPPEAAPPALPAGPGNSSASAAAAHASPQGIESSAGSNGKALGHGK